MDKNEKIEGSKIEKEEEFKNVGNDGSDSEEEVEEEGESEDEEEEKSKEKQNKTDILSPLKNISVVGDESIHEKVSLLNTKLKEKENVVIYIPQGYYGIITKNTPKNVVGLYTDGIGTCCGIVATAEGEEILFLAHIDEEIDMSDEEHGLPGWIKKMREIGSIKDLRVYCGRDTGGKRDIQLHYKKKLKQALIDSKYCKTTQEASKLIVQHYDSTDGCLIFRKDHNIAKGIVKQRGINLQEYKEKKEKNFTKNIGSLKNRLIEVRESIQNAQSNLERLQKERNRKEEEFNILMKKASNSLCNAQTEQKQIASDFIKKKKVISEKYPGYSEERREEIRRNLKEKKEKEEAVFDTIILNIPGEIKKLGGKSKRLNTLGAISGFLRHAQRSLTKKWEQEKKVLDRGIEECKNIEPKKLMVKKIEENIRQEKEENLKIQGFINNYPLSKTFFNLADVHAILIKNKYQTIARNLGRTPTEHKNKVVEKNRRRDSSAKIKVAPILFFNEDKFVEEVKIKISREKIVASGGSFKEKFI